MNIPTTSLPAPLSFLKGSSFNLTARSEVALRPCPTIVQSSIKTLGYLTKTILVLFSWTMQLKVPPPNVFEKSRGILKNKTEISKFFPQKPEASFPLSMAGVPEHVVVPDPPPPLGEGDPQGTVAVGVATQVQFQCFYTVLLFLGTHLSQHLMVFFFFLSEAFKITDDRFPNEVAEANTVTREPSASCVAGIPLVNFCHCRTGNAGASQMTHQLIP